MKPWKLLGTRDLVRDQWLAVRADRCELPGGHILDPYYVVEERDWVHVVALDDERRVLVVRQYRYAANTVCCELPGGVVDEGESAFDAARRELREETGCVAETWLALPSVFANPARQTNRVTCFLAEGARMVGAQSLDEAEAIEFEFLTIPSIMQLIHTGEFSQALHISSLSLALWELGLRV